MLLQPLGQALVGNDSRYEGRVALDNVALRLAPLQGILRVLPVDHGERRIAFTKHGCAQTIQGRCRDSIRAVGADVAGLAVCFVRRFLNAWGDLRARAVSGAKSGQLRLGRLARRKRNDGQLCATRGRRHGGREGIGIVHGSF